jgi:hypothetical protein
MQGCRLPIIRSARDCREARPEGEGSASIFEQWPDRSVQRKDVIFQHGLLEVLTLDDVNSILT